ncbi:FKBP-type peptidyl-prolyl cis-trans isomerase [Bythopirellula polymerisocia]|uniref:Peptidyl-prolyl cis-trans isomerase n=1 Tax=Bythopirellula polymerisocia TaxID=2528003 RepID=A0A5C6CTP1_9BACT|nr:peptidylprolyl isomerase [Bythopirellula polymerisocia]TWU28313.1 FKBP-type peptidyl-prolyl cis-trans isomerase SlyD [Bythopirellula polymerisocia]
MQIAKHKIVAIEYRLTDESGDEIDSTAGEGPLTYLHGMQEIIPGLEAALEGRVAGDSFQVTVIPEEAYGDRLEELLVELAREEFEDVGDLEVGMQFSLADEEDEEVFVTVVDFNDETVTVDGNHPLAGLTLHFDVKVCEVRDATAEEIEMSESPGECGPDCGCDELNGHADA